MLQDQKKWDARFAGKLLQAPREPGFIVEREGLLPAGRALDVACGDGAAALYLAQSGRFEDVLAADISTEGLKRLSHFAAERSLNVRCVPVDLDDAAALQGLRGDDADGHQAGFAVITLCHFKPSLVLLQQLLGLLAPGGHLLLSTFNEEHHRQNGFSKRFCLAPDEFLAVAGDVDCTLYQSVERGGSFMDDYHFISRA